jgi:radical SAM protein with 4Fe4S-binding SPASM domain
MLSEDLEVKRPTTLVGSCYFDDRLFIDAEGRFHICDKMNDKFPFGDVNSGFDFEKMDKIVREFTGLIKTHCLDCDARLLCHRCYIHFAKNGVFTVDPVFCEGNIRVWKELFAIKINKAPMPRGLINRTIFTDG